MSFKEWLMSFYDMKKEGEYLIIKPPIRKLNK